MDGSLKNMADGSYASLGKMGLYDNGYFVYYGKISYPKTGKLAFHFYNDDWHGVYIDGKYIRDLSGNKYCEMAKIMNLPQGEGQNHRIKIIYENEGRNDRNAVNKQLKGLVSVRWVADPRSIKIDSWKISPNPAGPLTKQPVQAQRWFYDQHWPTIKSGNFQKLYTMGLVNQTSSWYRGYFHLTEKEMRSNHFAPTLDLQAIYGDATVFINGRKLTSRMGRYASFNVSLKDIVHRGINSIAIYIKNGLGLGGIYRPAIVRFTNYDPVKINLQVRQGLYGQLKGWAKPHEHNSVFDKSIKIDQYKGSNHITWYRSIFNLSPKKRWIVPLAVKMKASGDAQVWVNGHLIGRYFQEGPQKMFYLPQSWLQSGQNTLVLVVRPATNSRGGPEVNTISIVPYNQYVVKKNDVKLKFK
jgi:hypothetical protein